MVEGDAFWCTSVAENRADAQYCLMAGAGVEAGVGSFPGGNGCTLNVFQTCPRSTGTVQLRSADPMDLPFIDPNYLTDPFDVECLVQATEFGRHIMSRSSMAGHILGGHVPAEPLRTRDDYRKFVRRKAHAALHPVGTCKIGADVMAVVGNQLRVHGIDGLRVADNSIAPTLCFSNTNAQAIMIGDHIQRAG